MLLNVIGAMNISVWHRFASSVVRRIRGKLQVGLNLHCLHESHGSMCQSKCHSDNFAMK